MYMMLSMYTSEDPRPAGLLSAISLPLAREHEPYRKHIGGNCQESESCGVGAWD